MKEDSPYYIKQGDYYSGAGTYLPSGMYVCTQSGTLTFNGSRSVAQGDIVYVMSIQGANTLTIVGKSFSGAQAAVVISSGTYLSLNKG